MSRSATVLRISFGLVVLTTSILLGMDLMGVVPTPDSSARFEARAALCEAVAAQLSEPLARDDFARARILMQGVVLREPDVLSVGYRGAGERLLLATGSHNELWSPAGPEGSTASDVRVPVFKKGRRVGDIEVHLTEMPGPDGLFVRIWRRPLIRMVFLVALLGFVSYAFYIRRTLRHLDPSAVIPTRVQAALDVMTEGVLLVDEREHVVLANAALAERLGLDPSSLLGTKPSSLAWETTDAGASSRLPWQEAIFGARPSEGARLRFTPRRGKPRSFIVNAAPVLDGNGNAKGAIATFDDVTELEFKSKELEQAMTQLEKSRDEVRLQNEELQTLARTDPLTGIANRRSFLEMAASRFQQAVEAEETLSCLMADIDNFKLINDNYGHSTGDEIIQRVAAAAVSVVRSREQVCRYGGEEFCILLPRSDSRDASATAERIRKAVEQEGFSDPPVTLSVGVASLTSSRAEDLTELINQADEALYAAKAAGRNQVVRYEAVHAWRA